MEPATEFGTTGNTYQVLAKLATGGMAEIFLARSAGVAAVQRYVVLKRVLRDRASDINWVRMFLDEARLAAQLQHPNIAQVYDVGKLGDSYFFTMEFVHGETVRSLISRTHQMRKAPPIGCVLAIAAGTAAGLQHAHARSGIDGRPLVIVHRDISPSNLMVGYDGSVKVVDFGVAKAADRVHETQSGAVKGKISYLSPEQARGLKVDARSDLFSLGIVVWELLTVERLYKHASDFETMDAIINTPTPPPSSRRGDIPADLDALVLKMLAKKPEDRFQTADEVAEAIDAIAARTASPLSPAGLSRWMRELFGNRREPWVELQRPERGPELVTVTSEPIPKQLEIPINDPIDRRLASVIDLSAVTPSDDAPERPTTQRPIALPVTDSNIVTRPPAAAPSRRWLRSPLALVVGAISLGVLAGVIIALAPSGDPLATIDASVAAGAPTEAAPAIVVEPDVAPVNVDAPVVVDAPGNVDADVAIASDASKAPIDAVDAPFVVAEQTETPPPRVKKKPVNPDIVLAADCATRDYAACTLAACRLRDARKAKRWFDKAGAAQRPKLIKDCTGIRLGPTAPDCKTDPYACPP